MPHAFTDYGITVNSGDWSGKLSEDAIRGPGRKVPKVMRDPMITVRNRETLNRTHFQRLGQLEQDAEPDELCPGLLHQAARGSRRPAGGDRDVSGREPQARIELAVALNAMAG